MYSRPRTCIGTLPVGLEKVPTKFLSFWESIILLIDEVDRSLMSVEWFEDHKEGYHQKDVSHMLETAKDLNFQIYKMRRRILIPWDAFLLMIKRVFMFEVLNTVGLAEGNGTPLQYSCLENPMDGGAWWSAVHGVAKSRTRLSDFPFTFHFHALEKEMATHSSVLAWRIPGTGEPGGLPSMGSHRVGHDWSDLAAAAAATLWA